MGWGAAAWRAGEARAGGMGGAGTHSGDAGFLVVAHAPVHCSYDEDVFSLGLAVKQRGGGEFTCRREGCVREGSGGPGRDPGRRGRARKGGGREGKNREGNSRKEGCL